MDLDRMSYVLHRYPQLQGLRLLPFSALFALSAAWRAAWFRLPGDGGRWFFAGFVAAAAASYPLRAWYTTRFGTQSQQMKDSSLVLIVAVAVCLPIATALQDMGRLPFSLPLVLVAAVMAGVGRHSLRRHFIGAAVPIAALAFARTLGAGPETFVALMDAATAVALAIVGAGDHRLVVTTLTRVNRGPARAEAVHADV